MRQRETAEKVVGLALAATLLLPQTGYHSPKETKGDKQNVPRTAEVQEQIVTFDVYVDRVIRQLFEETEKHTLFPSQIASDLVSGNVTPESDAWNYLLRPISSSFISRMEEYGRQYRRPLHEFPFFGIINGDSSIDLRMDQNSEILTTLTTNDTVETFTGKDSTEIMGLIENFLSEQGGYDEIRLDDIYQDNAGLYTGTLGLISRWDPAHPNPTITFGIWNRAESLVAPHPYLTVDFSTAEMATAIWGETPPSNTIIKRAYYSYGNGSEETLISFADLPVTPPMIEVDAENELPAPIPEVPQEEPPSEAFTPEPPNLDLNGLLNRAANRIRRVIGRTQPIQE